MYFSMLKILGQIRKKGNFAKQNFPDIFNGTHASRLAPAGLRAVLGGGRP